jgi:hypothetical protein
MINLSYARLIDAAGKEPLGGGVSVGVTATLQNAVVAFEARPGPSWVLCTISGGNLVAVDDVGGEIDPRSPTAFTTIDRTASSSATLQDAETLQAASFQGEVALNVNSVYTGTLFPTGTRQAPVNNIADAISIAEARGLRTISVLSNMTLGSGDFSDGYTFLGDSPAHLTLTVDSAADITNCVFKEMTIQGMMDGENVIRNCIVENITFFNGEIIESALNGTVTLGGGIQADIFDCYSNVAGGGAGQYPMIDMGGSGQSLVLRNYSGGIGVLNQTGAGDSSFDMNSGRVTFENTVTAGNFVVRGIADVTDLSSGTAVVTDSTITSTLNVVEGVLRNKTVTDPVTGIMTIYDTDGVTPLLTAQMYEDAAGTQTYQGDGGERRERLT